LVECNTSEHRCRWTFHGNLLCAHSNDDADNADGGAGGDADGDDDAFARQCDAATQRKERRRRTRRRRGRTSFTSCVLGSSGSRGVPVLWWYVRRVSPGGGFGTRGIESLRGSSSLTVMCRRLAPRSVWAAAGMSPVREPPTPAAARARPPPSDRDLPSRALKAVCLFTKLSFVLTAITAELVAAEMPSGPRHGSGTLRKTAFLSHLYIKTIILPRQARDKHRENSKKDAVFPTRIQQPNDRLARCRQAAASSWPCAIHRPPRPCCHPGCTD
jgi:hypothetical protein